MHTYQRSHHYRSHLSTTPAYAPPQSVSLPRKISWYIPAKRIMVLFTGLCLASSFIQIAYPRTMMLPFTRVGDISLAFNSKSAASTSLSALSPDVTVRLNDQLVVINARDLALTTDVTSTIGHINDYSLAERAIPFSIFFNRQKRQLDRPIYSYNYVGDKTLEQLQTRAARPAQNAAIAISETGVEITNEVLGTKLSQEAAHNSLRAYAKDASKGTLRPELEVMVPARTAATLAPIEEHVSKLITSTLTLNYGGRIAQLPGTELKTWITFSDDPTKPETVVVQADTKKVRDYLIALDDGFMNSNEPKRIKLTESNTQVVAALQPENKTTAAELTVEILNDQQKYIRKYSQGPTGLQSLLNDFAASKGSRYALGVQELGDMERRAVIGEHKAMVPASTYKLFIAHLMLEHMEKNGLAWSDTTTSGIRYDTCLDRMIIISDDACANSIGAMLGWAFVDQRLKELGYQATILDNHDSAGNYLGPKQTSIYDQMLVLSRLATGQLAKEDLSAKLLSNMKRQIYRSGIPSGAKNSIVADKVGIYAAYLNDSGIVYGKNTTYIVSILSTGGSWGDMATLTRQLELYFGNE
jgi:beta-lactamase class A